MTAQTNTLSDELVERLRDYRSDWHKRMGDVSVLDDAISGIERIQEEARKLSLLVGESLYHLRLDERAELYHKKALAALSADMGEDQ
jgi:hypothetical protein